MENLRRGVGGPRDRLAGAHSGLGARRGGFALFFALMVVFTLVNAPAAHAGFIGPYDPGQWAVMQHNSDGSVAQTAGGIEITGSSTGSGNSGAIDYVIVAPFSGTVTFSWFYFSLDIPTLDNAGYLLNGVYTVLADTTGQTGTNSFSVVSGDTFGFRVATMDNQFDPGIFDVTSFNAPGPSGGDSTVVPEPATAVLMISCLAGLFLVRRGGRANWRWARVRSGALTVAATLCAASVLSAQSAIHYNGTNATGRLKVATQVNLASLAQPSVVTMSLAMNGATPSRDLEIKPNVPASLLRPPLALSMLSAVLSTNGLTPLMQSTPVITATTSPLGVPGLSHMDQRNANNGNQFSVEPPNVSIASGNGYILQGVNNAIQVYTTAGVPMLPTVLSSNQVFGLAPAIDRVTNIQGPFPTDMRVFWDGDIRRWFIIQRIAANDALGNPIAQSQIYMAVSQTDNPIGTYTVYVIDTTNAGRSGCPCISDYPQIGADQNGFYISSNEFDFNFLFRDVSILAISKASLGSGAAVPTMVEFVIPPGPGYEFTVHPATTPPGASYFIANGGLEYFVSSNANLLSDSTLAVWAMTNTQSLGTAFPNLALVETFISTMTYSYPPSATQAPGILTYGGTLGVRSPAPLDGGDPRVQSCIYSGGRLYVTLATKVVDKSMNPLVGGAYFVISTAYRSGTLSAAALRQGYVMTDGSNLLRPAIAVDAQGRGAIVFTLVGPSQYPSAAFVPFSNFTAGAAIQIAGAGLAPEDGFTGYSFPFVARWGDYSSAVVGDDGNVYLSTEYIPQPAGGPRTQLANWGTFLIGIPPG